MGERPNIAIVVLDTLRKDVFDEHFNWLSGRRFEQAWSPSHWTVPVHASLFTGKYASELGVHAKSKCFDCSEQSLAELLRESGYTTRAFSNNINISSRNNFDRGFDHFDGGWRLDSVQSDEELFNWSEFISKTTDDSVLRYARAVGACIRSEKPTLNSLKWGATLKLHDLGLGPHADDGAADTLSYLREVNVADEGEFMFINLMEAHLPYSPPRKYRTERVDRIEGLLATVGDLSSDPDAVRQAYKDCVRYLSDIYEDIFAELSDKYDYVITLSDHGELLGEHGAWAHSYSLYPELVHVPLLIFGPEIEDGSTDTIVSLLDVYQTVVELADLEVESRGHSLLTNLESNSYLTEYHGLDSHQQENLRTAGFVTQAKEMDQSLDGFITDGYYRCEALNGWYEEGNAPLNYREKFESLLEERDIQDVTDTGERSIDSDVESQLRELGYR